MTLQAFKEAEFESSSLRIVPIAPKKISHLDELPNFSYHFQHATGPFTVCYNFQVLGDATHINHPHPSMVRAIVRGLVNATAGASVRIDHNLSFYAGLKEFYTQSMTNMLRLVGVEDPENGRSERSAAIREHGDAYVPLHKGASLHICDSDQLSQMRSVGPTPRWDIILKGDMVWFGKRRKYYVSHPHCQGFEFENIIGFTDQLHQACLTWFPFLDGHICFDTIEVVTNPVSHQGMEARRNG